MMITEKRIFIGGLVLFAASFLMPIGGEGLGYNLALVVFEMSYKALGSEQLLYIFLLTITNVSALSILLSYFKYHSKIITMIGGVGTLIAFSWILMLLVDSSFQYVPPATIGWAIGILLLTTSYEMKRRMMTPAKSR